MQTAGKQFCWKMTLDLSPCSPSPSKLVGHQEKHPALFKRSQVLRHPFLNFCILWGAFPTMLRSFPRRIWELAEVKLWSVTIKQNLNSFKSQCEVPSLIFTEETKKADEICLLLEKNTINILCIILQLLLQDLLS